MTSPRFSTSSRSAPPGWQPLQACPPVACFGTQRLDYLGAGIGVQAALGGCPPPSKTLSSPICAQHGGAGGGLRDGDRSTPPEAGDLRTLRPWSGVLCPSFRHSKDVGGLAPYHGLVPPQPVSASYPVQDGHASPNQGVYPTWGLGHVHRSQGRLFPNPHPPRSPPVSQVRVEGQSVPILCPPLWAFPCPLPVYQGGAGVGVPGQVRVHSPLRLSGRLAHSGPIQGSLRETHRQDAGTVLPTGVCYQPGEMRSIPESVIRLLRDEIRHAVHDSLSYPGPVVPAGEAPCGVTPVHPRDSAGSDLPHRDDGVSGPPHSVGQSTQTSPSTGIETSLVSTDATLGHPDLSGGVVPLSHSRVARHHPPGSGHTHSSPHSAGGPLYGRLDSGLGRSHGPTPCVGDVVPRGGQVAHQRAGARGSQQSSTAVRGGGLWQGHSPVHGQHHGGLLCEQRGGGALGHPLPQGRGSPPLVSQPGHLAGRETHRRQSKHPSGCPQQVQERPTDRVDARPSHPAGCVGRLVSSNGGPLRDEVQQEAPPVCVSGSGPGSLGRGRSVLGLGQSSGLRLSPLPDPVQGDPEGQVRAPTTHPDRAQVARSALVPGPAGTHSRSSNGTDGQARSTEATPFGDSPRESSAAPPSRVAALRPRVRAPELTSPAPRISSVQEALSGGGASTDLRSLVSDSRRAGTEALYDFRWNKWLAWCSEQGVPTTCPSSVQLANFLAHLSSVLGLSASTVRGYRSAVCTTIRQLGGPSFEDDFLLREVSRGASLREARNPRRVPQWDLFLVLDFLRTAPFEPLVSIPFDLLTLKTTFLLALATGRRRSEIHGLSGSPQDIAFHNDGSISLRFLPEFLAKNQEPGTPSPPLKVRPLSDILPRGEEDRNLCPVRCLKYYWDRSRGRRSTQRRLLISVNEKYQKDISAGTISRWITQVIQRAYSQAQRDLDCLSPRAHEVRAIATSAAFQHSAPLQHVLEAAFWRSENPFINHYLRDFRMKRADGSKGISFVAANTAIAVPRTPHANC